MYKMCNFVCNYETASYFSDNGLGEKVSSSQVNKVVCIHSILKVNFSRLLAVKSGR